MIVRPTSLAEALQALASDAPGVRPIAGGTALMLLTRSGFFRPSLLVSLHRIPELGEVVEADGEIRLGAMVTLRDLERSSLVRTRIPVLGNALTTLANVRVRNIATVGGHVAHADPHLDLPPVLAALRARVALAGGTGHREVPVEDFILGYYDTALGPGELIRQIRIPVPAPEAILTYTKFTALSSDDWPTLGVATHWRRAKGRLADVRVVLGSVTDRPVRLTAAEEMLEGQTLTIDLRDEAARAAGGELDIASDQNGSAAYKREMVRVHVRRALSAAGERPQ